MNTVRGNPLRIETRLPYRSVFHRAVDDVLSELQ